MHARCCEKCHWVVHCLGKLLESTNVIEPVCDIWHEKDIAVHPMRWYGDQIQQADCTIILASDKMKTNYAHEQNAASSNNDCK